MVHISGKIAGWLQQFWAKVQSKKPFMLTLYGPITKSYLCRVYRSLHPPKSNIPIKWWKAPLHAHHNTSSLYFHHRIEHSIKASILRQVDLVSVQNAPSFTARISLSRWWLHSHEPTQIGAALFKHNKPFDEQRWYRVIHVAELLGASFTFLCNVVLILPMHVWLKMSRPLT